MRANQLPTTEEVLAGHDKPRASEEEARQAIETAITAVELLTGTKIREEARTITILADSGTYRIDDHPIRDAEHDGPGNQIIILGEMGTAEFEAPLSEYTFIYKVGHREGELPALERELILKLARYETSGDKADLEGADALLTAARRERQNWKEGRDRYEADGEEARQGVNQHLTRRYPL